MSRKHPVAFPHALASDDTRAFDHGRGRLGSGSLLLRSAAARLVGAGGLVALIWLGVAWALR